MGSLDYGGFKDMSELYSKRFLQERLKAEGLPSGYKTIMGYEKKGIIKTPKQTLKQANGVWRMYSSEEISENVSRVKEYKGKEKDTAPQKK